MSNRARPDGLLRPLTPPLGPFEQHTFSDTPSNIRASTVQLSALRISSASPSRGPPHPTPSFVSSPPREFHSPSPLKIEPSTPRAVVGPSALSVLIAESRATSREPSRSPTEGLANGSPECRSTSPNVLTHKEAREQHQRRDDSIRQYPDTQRRTSGMRSPSVSETTPLLVSCKHHTFPVSYAPIASPPVTPNLSTPAKSRWTRMSSLKQHFSPPSPRDALRAIPAVVLGLLLNILDGVSYGMIVFPAAGVFAGFGGTGVSMFFVT